MAAVPALGDWVRDEGGVEGGKEEGLKGAGETSSRKKSQGLQAGGRG